MAAGSKGSSVLSYGSFKEVTVSAVLRPQEVIRQCCLIAALRKGSSVLCYGRLSVAKCFTDLQKCIPSFLSVLVTGSDQSGPRAPTDAHGNR